jgi:hypothetical protein
VASADVGNPKGGPMIDFLASIGYDIFVIGGLLVLLIVLVFFLKYAIKWERLL